MGVISGNLYDGKPMDVGGFYNGRVWTGSSLLAPGLDLKGNPISNEVIAQTNPDNVAYIEAQKIQAPSSTQIPYSSGAQADFITGIQGEATSARTTLDNTLVTQKAAVDAKLADAKQVQTDTMAKIEPLTTPFRADLEATQRDALHINENFDANQKLVDELDTLLTQGNDLITQQKAVTGLSAVRNPRIQKTMNDVTARAGVITAVIQARNGQISVAENMIDRTSTAITADRQDQIAYYQAVLDLNSKDIVSLDSKSLKLADEQIQLLKDDVANTQATSDYLKKLMIDPATALLVGQAGVKLTDTVETVNAKLGKAVYAKEVADLSNSVTKDGGIPVVSPNGIPVNELRTLTDSKGVKHYYQVKEKTPASTVSERSISDTASTISKNNMNFPDVVIAYANQLSLSDIYAAYNQSQMGKTYGLPKDNPTEINLLYQLSQGKITQAQYREAMGVTQ